MTAPQPPVVPGQHESYRLGDVMPAPQPKKTSTGKILLIVGIVVGVLCLGGGATAVVALGALDQAVDEATSGVQASTPTPAAASTCSYGVDSNGAVVCSSPGATPAAAPADDAPATGRVGDTVTLTTSDGGKAYYTVTKVEQKTSDRYGDRPKKGVYLLAHLKVEVVSGEFFACDCDMSFVGPDKKVYEPTYATFSGHDEFEATDLNGGQNTDGWIVWDLPKSALKGGQIQYRADNWYDEDAISYWKL